jgi:hypothetical protein
MPVEWNVIHACVIARLGGSTPRSFATRIQKSEMDLDV